MYHNIEVLSRPHQSLIFYSIGLKFVLNIQEYAFI